MAAPSAVAARWISAMSRHDLDDAVACFDPDYRDVAPARRGEAVVGLDEVRKNFARLFHDLPDLSAQILGAVDEGDRVWVEWRMQGTRSDGSRMEFTGVNIFGVRDDRFAWGRIYTELVRDSGGVDEQVRRMTGRSGA
jgi:ketosteroid isomerase-like protein